ncbi:protein S100-A5-like [Syngnathus acus]|uniref:protein S100-A5-like n=1 Tax=Syngnathus acus TaxID=161584 RepID=UPI001885F647|nr:protein S100-A5-like [Syngnathus acus]
MCEMNPTPLEQTIFTLCKVFSEHAEAEGNKDTLNKNEVKKLVKTELPHLFKAAQGDPEGQTLLMDFDGDGEMNFKEFMVVLSCLACIFKAHCPKK